MYTLTPRLEIYRNELKTPVMSLTRYTPTAVSWRCFKGFARSSAVLQAFASAALI